MFWLNLICYFVFLFGTVLYGIPIVCSIIEIIRGNEDTKGAMKEKDIVFFAVCCTGFITLTHYFPMVR